MPTHELRHTIRYRCGLLLVCLVSQAIDIDTFEKSWPQSDLDQSINAIFRQIDTFYSDNDDYWRDDLPISVKKCVLLCVAFLMTSYTQYKWPPFPEVKSAVFWMSKKAKLKQEALEERSWASWRRHGNDKVWPFHERNDACTALLRLKLIRKELFKSLNGGSVWGQSS